MLGSLWVTLGPHADAPWCGHCQRLAPEFAQAAATLRNGSEAVRLGKVDATAQVGLSTEFGINAYPTLKLFRDGNRTHPLAYTGRATVPHEGGGVHSGGHREGCLVVKGWRRGDGERVAAMRW